MAALHSLCDWEAFSCRVVLLPKFGRSYYRGNSSEWRRIGKWYGSLWFQHHPNSVPRRYYGPVRIAIPKQSCPFRNANTLRLVAVEFQARTIQCSTTLVDQHSQYSDSCLSGPLFRIRPHPLGLVGVVPLIPPLLPPVPMVEHF